jgi:hypothetical protein
VRCGFLRIYAPTTYSAVFLLHAPTPAPTPIKIGYGAVWCDSYGFIGCVDEAYTPILITSVPSWALVEDINGLISLGPTSVSLVSSFQ